MPKIASVICSVLLLGSASAPVAGGAVPSRQDFDLRFTSKAPKASTGFTETIDYRNPADPDAKPPAVATIVVRLAPGTRIDTSVPAACAATDADLMLQGSGACPPTSAVGGGEVQLDTGIPGPGRLVRSGVQLFNNADQVIFLFTEEQTGSRVVSRAQATRDTFTTTAPPLPGGPPDNFTAIDTVRLEVPPLTAVVGARPRPYIRTPRRCPANRRWVSTATFTYRDGVSETVTSASRCHPRR